MTQKQGKTLTVHGRFSSDGKARKFTISAEIHEKLAQIAENRQISIQEMATEAVYRRFRRFYNSPCESLGFENNLDQIAAITGRKQTTCLADAILDEWVDWKSVELERDAHVENLIDALGELKTGGGHPMTDGYRREILATLANITANNSKEVGEVFDWLDQGERLGGLDGQTRQSLKDEWAELQQNAKLAEEV